MYAPTTDYENKEVESFYEDIYMAMQQHNVQCALVTGDFNAKLGLKPDESEKSMVMMRKTLEET